MRNCRIKLKKIIKKLGNNAEKLIEQLRISSLENIHEISLKFKHEVKVNFRQSRNQKTPIATFNTKTAKVFKAKVSEERVTITAIITRFNIFTGNGRLKSKDATETTAFGFGVNYGKVPFPTQKKFSENLNSNNGLHENEWEYLKLVVRRIMLRGGKVVKYIVVGMFKDE